MALRRFLIKPSEAAIRDLYRALTTRPPNDVQAQPDDLERVTAGTLGGDLRPATRSRRSLAGPGRRAAQSKTSDFRGGGGRHEA